MASQVRLKFRIAGFRELRTQPSMSALVGELAEEIAATANAGQPKGYVAEITANPRSRARAAVIAAHPWARNDNAKHQTLVRSIRGR